MKLQSDIISQIIACGFDVYMRNPNDSWAYFTDGKRIGYIQYCTGQGLTLSTVHIPGKECGTGFQAGNLYEITRETLSQAFVIAPSWASSRDRLAFQKWRDWDHFKNSNSFNKEYKKVNLAKTTTV